MIFVTDRDVEDLMRAEELTGKIASGGWDSLDTSEQGEWLAGLKGCYNATDLERVDANTITLAAMLRAVAIPITIQPYSGWGRNSFPVPSQMERIRSNIIALRGALQMPQDAPAVPANLDYMDIAKANAIERIQEIVYTLLAAQPRLQPRVYVLRAGEGMRI